MDVFHIALFPEMLDVLHHGVTARAFEKDVLRLHSIQLRDFAPPPHRAVDDKPYGGGAGMLLTAPVVSQAMEHVLKAPNADSARRIYFSPQGKPLTQAVLKELSEASALIMLSGRYEGVDQRVLDHYAFESYSLGDYVLSGGELAALVCLDGIIRLLPGVLGNTESATSDSFSAPHILEGPQYTRPEVFASMRVPDVLLSGDHARIAHWRRQQALAWTLKHRPDLLDLGALSEEERTLLNGLIERET